MCERWVGIYDHPNGSSGFGYDYGWGLAADPLGERVFITGTSISDETASLDIFTAAYASGGGELWAKRYDGPMGRADYGLDLAASPDGRAVFVTGLHNNLGELGLFKQTGELVTIAYDAISGEELWVASHPGQQALLAHGSSIAASDDGTTLYVAGYARNGQTESDFIVVAYDARDGEHLWTGSYDGPGSGDDYGLYLALSPSGDRVFVTGHSSEGSEGGFGQATVAFEASDEETLGEQLWVARLSGAANTARGIAVTPDGSLVLVAGVGEDPPGSSSTEYATIAYDAETGERVWERRYRGSPERSGVAMGLALDPAGGQVFVTGYLVGPEGNPDHEAFATIAYAARSGELLWEQRYSLPHSSVPVGQVAPFAVATSPDGERVYVTGVSFRGEGVWGSDASTVAYEAEEGDQLWVARYNGGHTMEDFSFASRVVAAPTGVYVMGTNVPRIQSLQGNTFDVRTLAYDL